MGIPGSGKKAINTRIQNLIAKGLNEAEARAELSNQMKAIGAKGGKNGTTGGFAANPELARIAGAKGGSISRRGKKNVEV